MPRAPIVSSQSIRSEILYLRYMINNVNRHEAAKMPIYCTVEMMKAFVLSIRCAKRTFSPKYNIIRFNGLYEILCFEAQTVTNNMSFPTVVWLGPPWIFFNIFVYVYLGWTRPMHFDKNQIWLLLTKHLARSTLNILWLLVFAMGGLNSTLGRFGSCHNKTGLGAC